MRRKIGCLSYTGDGNMARIDSTGQHRAEEPLVEIVVTGSRLSSANDSYQPVSRSSIDTR
jgi:hypothetical protein